MFIDQLCRMIGILETFIRIFVGCLATFEVNRLGRLVLTLPLSMWCVGRINSVISYSQFGNFAFFDVCRFGFVFDDFVFEFAEWDILRVKVGLNFVFFGSLLKCEFDSVGRTFYAICGNFERNFFAHYFLLVLRENRVFIEDYVTTPVQFSILRVP